MAYCKYCNSCDGCIDCRNCNNSLLCVNCRNCTNCKRCHNYNCLDKYYEYDEVSRYKVINDCEYITKYEEGFKKYNDILSYPYSLITHLAFKNLKRDYTYEILFNIKNFIELDNLLTTIEQLYKFQEYKFEYMINKEMMINIPKDLVNHFKYLKIEPILKQLKESCPKYFEK